MRDQTHKLLITFRVSPEPTDEIYDIDFANALINGFWDWVPSEKQKSAILENQNSDEGESL